MIPNLSSVADNGKIDVYIEIYPQKWKISWRYNVNPGLTNHGLLIRGYSPNSHDLIIKWHFPS